MDSDSVKKLAELSRIAIQDEEARDLKKDLQAILSYVEKIGEVSDTPEHTKLSLHRNVMRPDGAPHEKGAYTDELLEAAPKTKGRYIQVKKILP